MVNKVDKHKVDKHIVVAPVFATNCCILVAGNDALVVDAGAGVRADVIALVEKNGWQVRAVAATHGHADHTWDAGPLCDHFGVPFLIHDADKYRISDPIGTLQTDVRPDQSVAIAIAQAVRALGVGDYQTPPNIIPFGPNVPVEGNTPAVELVETKGGTGAKLKLGAIELDLIFAPGHTQGSTLYQAEDFVLSGDVLFAGSIGRTDLPGGNPATMTETLRRLAQTLKPELVVIPGHGPATTVAQELATNPYWKAATAG